MFLAVPIYYLSKEAVLTLHKVLMKDYNNKGLMDDANLDFALYQAQRDAYSSVLEKACATIYWIIHGQCFQDGNKRTALVCANVFLNANGYEFEIARRKFIDFLVDVQTKKGEWSGDPLAVIKRMARWIKDHVREDDEISEKIREEKYGKDPFRSFKKGLKEYGIKGYIDKLLRKI